MNLRAIFRLRAYREEWEANRDLLAKNEQLEDNCLFVLRTPALFVEGDEDHFPRRILALRRERVEILRRLGWNDAADNLEADNAMRAPWIEGES